MGHRDKQHGRLKAREKPAAPHTTQAPSPALLAGSAGLAGTLTLLSFPPFGCGWLMWFALAPLFAVHSRLRPGPLFVYGYLLAAVPVGAIAFCVLASSALMFVVFAVSVPLAFAAGIVAATRAEARIASPWARIFVFPCFAVAVEFLLGNETIRVPATLALTQAEYPLVIQNADIFGTAGTTFLLLLINRSWPILWQLVIERRGADGKCARVGCGTEGARLGPVVTALGLLAVNLAYGRWAMERHGYNDATIPIAAVQPAIPTTDYVHRLVDSRVGDRIDQTVSAVTEEAIASNPKLLVVSEGSNGRFNFRIPSLRRRLEDTARRTGAAFVVSSPDMDAGGEQYNALFSLDTDGRLLGTYRKRLLTPIGERYVSRGEEQGPLPSAIGLAGAMVCFESCFPGVARALVRRGAQYLLVSTSDASFRNSAMALLHSRFSIFRAIETRRYLVQAANTGPSFVVRPTGETDATTPFLSRAVLSGRIGLRTERTPFVRLGALPPMIALGWLALALLRARAAPRPVRARGGHVIAARQAPWRVAATAAAYVATIALLGCTSVHLATRGTAQDRGPLRNVGAFLAEEPGLDVRQATREHLQRETNTCGPAALAFLLSTYGMDVRETDVVDHVRLEPQGTSMLALVRAAEHFGLRAWGERLNMAALRSERTPTIAYLPTRKHFVVVLTIEGGWVYVFDPAAGAVKLPEWEFARLWEGYVLQVRFPPLPEIDGRSLAIDGQSTDGIALSRAARDSDAPLQPPSSSRRGQPHGLDDSGSAQEAPGGPAAHRELINRTI